MAKTVADSLLERAFGRGSGVLDFVRYREKLRIA